MGKQPPGTQLAMLDEYARQGGFNVLRPVTTLVQGEAASEVLVAAISIVQIDPNPNAGETYHDFRFANERDGKGALSQLGLAKIAAAAGIKWVPDLTGVVDGPHRRADGHVYIRYRAAGAVREQNGEWHLEVAEKDIDTADEAEEMAETFRRQIRAGRARFTEEEIPDKVRQQLLQLKKFLLPQAETKAKNRVIRRLLTLKQVYTRDELAHPFVVPRLLYRPDLTDPQQLEQVQIQGRRAAAELYGGGPTVSPSSTAHVESSALPDGSSEQAPETVAYGEGAAAPDAASDSSASPPAEEAMGDTPSAGGTEPGMPKTDPVFEDGPYKGQHWSEVAPDHPEFFRGAMQATKIKSKRELMQAWLHWFFPTIGDE